MGKMRGTGLSTSLILASMVLAVEGLLDNYSNAYSLWSNQTIQKYDHRLRPGFGGESVNVSVDLDLMSISDFSESKMWITVEMYFRQLWEDPRLAFNESMFGDETYLDLDQRAIKTFWKPDSSFLNAFSSTYPRHDSSPTHRQHMKLYSNGSIYYSQRLSITFGCTLDLVMFPFDQQACHFKLSSYGMSQKDIIYRWHEEMKVNLDKVSMPSFEATNYKQNQNTENWISGHFSILDLCIELKRNSGFAFLQLFIPSTAVVASSWIALFISEDTQFADIVTVILAIIFLGYSYNQMMPQVSYVKAMDIYLGACLVFVFLALAKLAVVKYLIKKKKEGPAKSQVVVVPPTEDLAAVAAKVEALAEANVEGDGRLTTSAIMENVVGGEEEEKKEESEKEEDEKALLENEDAQDEMEKSNSGGSFGKEMETDNLLTAQLAESEHTSEVGVSPEELQVSFTSQGSRLSADSRRSNGTRPFPTNVSFDKTEEEIRSVHSKLDEGGLKSRSTSRKSSEDAEKGIQPNGVEGEEVTLATPLEEEKDGKKKKKKKGRFSFSGMGNKIQIVNLKDKKQEALILFTTIFHYGSQIALPAVFGSFAFFFFVIYPTFVPPSNHC